VSATASRPDGKPEGEAADAAVVAGRGALFIGFAKIYFMVSGLIQQLALNRVLGAVEYGAYGVVTSVISIVNNTIVQATVQAVSKFTAEDDRRAGAVQRAGLRMQAVLGVLVGVALIAVAPLIAAFEKAPQYTPYFRIAAAIPVIYALYTVFVGTANGLRRFHVQASFDIAFSTIKTILVIGLGAVLAVKGAFIGFVAAAVAILVVAARKMRMPQEGPPFPAARLVPYMGGVGVYTLLLNLALLYDQPLVGHFAGVVDRAQGPIVAGHYYALRTLAVLPYQALIVITFVIFPLVSQSTFAEDRGATRAYVTQTMRLALILASAMGLALAARPAALLAIAYKPEFGVGATALPVLVAGECCLAILGVACSILNAAGRTRATMTLMTVTMAIGASASAILVPRTAPGASMLVAAASATSLGMAVGLVGALVILRVRLGGGLPAATVARVAVSLAAAVVVGRFLPVHGKILGLATIALVVLVYLAGLVALGELGADDKAKIRRILRRG
jgi:O-antigen/teichoic acid export membrane protein